MCLLKTLYTISDVYINRLSVRHYWHVWQFTISYPFCIIQNDPVTYKMWSYVIQWLASPIPTFNTWADKFSTHKWCITLNNFNDLFNLILILAIDAWCFHPTSIHVSSILILIRLSHMHEHLTYFIKGVVISHLGRPFLYLIHMYKYLLLNLIKFWQHFALISKYTTWKRWH